MLKSKRIPIKTLKQPNWCNFQVTDNIYNRIVDVYIGDRKKTISCINKKYDLKESIKKSITTVSGGVTILLKSEDDNEYYIVWLEQVVDEYIAHECFHLVYMIMNALSITLQESNQESWAYYIGFLVKEINKQAIEKGFKRVG